MKYTLSKIEKEDITDKISSFLTSYQKTIITVYLFGSFLAEREFSDIDIAILLSGDISQPLDFELALEGKLEQITGYPTDVRVLNKAPLAFTHNVIKTGRIIVDMKPNLRAEFQGNILKQYFDFSRFHKRYLKEVVNAPV